MIIFMIQYLFLFITGSIIGWCLEVLYRRYLGKARKWINPGFLSGPFLPIYGSGICLLYAVSDLEVGMIVKIPMFALITTGVEFLTGMFFLKYYKTRLWDYTQLWLNVQGIVSPLYTFYWTLLSLMFYYILYPFFYARIEFIYANLELSLIIGIVLGVILVDMSNSFNLVNRLKQFAETFEGRRVVINYEQLKIEIRERFEELTDRFEDLEGGIEFKMTGRLRKILRSRQRPTFMLPFKGDYELAARLYEHIEKIGIRRKDKKVD